MLVNINMETKSIFLKKADFQQQCFESLRRLKEIKSNAQEAIDEDLLTFKGNSFHFINKILIPQNNFEATFFALIKKNLLQTEKLSGNSSRIYYDFFLRYLENLLFLNEICNISVNENTLSKKFMEIWTETKRSIEMTSKPCTKQTLRTMIEKTCENKTLSAAIYESVMLAGLEGKILIENGKQDNYVVETKEGYNFNLNPYKFFLPNERSWQNTGVKILVVDGFVQTISEIDQILTKAMEIKEPLVIFATDFSEEVLATLKANQDKGNFEAIPVKIPPGLEGLNVLNDIATTCGTFPISCLQGQMLTFVKYDELKIIDKITITPSVVTIENNSSIHAVASQVKHLLEKREQEKWNEDIVDMLDARLKTLVSNAVILTLPYMGEAESDSIKAKIDVALRNVKSTLNYGFVNKKDIKKTLFPVKQINTVEDCYHRAIQETINNLPDEQIDCLNLAIGILLAGKAANMIFSSSGLVQKSS
jgi:hypothetical protein